MHTEYLACFTNLFNNQKSVKTVHNSLVLHTIIVINRDGSLRRAKAKIRLDVYATGDEQQSGAPMQAPPASERFKLRRTKP